MAGLYSVFVAVLLFVTRMISLWKTIFSVRSLLPMTNKFISDWFPAEIIAVALIELTCFIAQLVSPIGWLDQLGSFMLSLAFSTLVLSLMYLAVRSIEYVLEKQWLGLFVLSVIYFVVAIIVVQLMNEFLRFFIVISLLQVIIFFVLVFIDLWSIYDLKRKAKKADKFFRNN